LDIYIYIYILIKNKRLIGKMLGSQTSPSTITAALIKENSPTQR
jgi:hypothetical protein